MTNRERLLNAMSGSGAVSNRDKLISAMHGSGNISNRDKFMAAVNGIGNTRNSSSAPQTYTTVGGGVLDAPRTANPVGGGVPDTPNLYTTVGGDAHIAPQTSQQSTSTKPLTGFAAGVQANNAGYRALAQQKADKILNEPEQPLTGFAAGVQANNAGYRALAGKPSLGNYVWRKAVGGAAETAEGTANAAGYWYQGMVKSGELQHNNALRSVTATTKNPAAKAAMESYMDEYGINAQQVENITQHPTKTLTNFGDNYVAETEEKFADANFGTVGNLIGDVAQGAGGMLVRMPARLVPGLGEVVTFASAYGNAKQSAQKNGADEASASLYALGTATVELATEKMFGFAGSLGGGAADKALTWFVDRVAKSEAGKVALNTILGALGEGAEEFIAEYGQAYVDKLTTKMDGRSWKEVNKDAWYNALVGGITAVIFDTADIISGGNGKLPTAEELESVTTQAAEETVSSIAANTVVIGGNTENLQQNSVQKGMIATNYTTEQVMRIRWEGKTFRNIVAGIDTSVSNFFQKWHEGRKSHLGEKLEKLYLGALNEDVLGKVENVLGYAVDYRDVIVTNDDVKHILRGHPDLKDWVFDALPAVVVSPDFVGRGHKGTGKNSEKTGVIMKKTMPNGTVVTIHFDNPSRSTLQITTVYAKESTTPMVTEKSDTLTPKATEPVLSKINIPQVKNEVNGKTASEPSPFLYLGRLAEQAKINGNLYTQRLLQRQIEKALKNFGKTDTEASTLMPTIYADYMREHSMLEDYETSDVMNVDLENDANSDTMFAGAILGAYNDKNDPQGSKRDAHAEQYYSTLRNSNREDVVLRIAVNADVDIASVEKMYDHLIVNKYPLDEAYKSFDPDYDIAESLQRLREGKNILEHDRILIQHEAMEYDLMNKEGLSYKEAHDITNTVYNYQESLKMWLKNRR